MSQQKPSTFIQKSYPISVQDLVDLITSTGISDNLDLSKIFLILHHPNDPDGDYTDYMRSAFLNVDQDRISIECSSINQF